MNLAGNLTLLGGGLIENLRPEMLASEPSLVGLDEARVWYNTTDKVLKYYDGTQIWPIAKGGDLDNYLKRDGTNVMTGELTLSSTDQSAEADTAAISKLHYETGLATKEDNIIGAATSITQSDLGADLAVVSDASGKVAASATTSAQIGYLSTTTSDVQTQLDGKEPTIGYVTLNKAGDTMGGTLAMGTNQITGLGAPTLANDAARKIDIDNALSGMNWQNDVLDIQTDALLNPGAAPNKGDRYIITDHNSLHANFGAVAAEANDIVEFDGTDWVIALDVSADADSAGATAWNAQSTQFIRYEPTGSGWTEFGGLSSLVAGVGLVKTGNVIDVNMGAGIVQLPSDEVGLDVKTDGGIDIVDPTTGLHSVLTDAVVAIKLDGGSMTTNSNGLSISAEGVGSAEIASAALGNGLAGGAGVALNVVAKAAAGIIVDGDGVSVDLTFFNSNYINVDGSSPMSGDLTLANSTPTSDLHAASKKYVDDADGLQTQATTDLETRVEAGYFVYDGTGLASASHTVTHGMGNKFVGVTVVDETDEVIIPDSISYTDVNSLVVAFSTALKCRVVVNGLKL